MVSGKVGNDVSEGEGKKELTAEWLAEKGLGG